MLLLGIGLSIPACLLAAFAPSIEVLIVARDRRRVSAGMAYPTTLALITALWARARTTHRSRCGRRSAARSRRSAARRGLPARAVRLGLGVPRHAAARGVALSWPGASCPRT
jgi:MFS family permease